MGAVDRLNELERRSLEKLLAGEHRALSCLRGQMAAATVAGREETGSGFATRLEVPEGVPRLAVNRPLQILDVYGEVAGISGETGFILFIEEGALARLECQTLDDWPEAPRLERLFYMHPRSPSSSKLVETAVRDLDWALDGVDGKDPADRGRTPGDESAAGRAKQEATMAILNSDERSPDETQAVSSVFARPSGKGADEPPSGVRPAVTPAAAAADAEAPAEATLSPRRVMALVTINAVLATVLGIELVALLIAARGRPVGGPGPGTGLAGLAGDPLLEALVTFAVAGAMGACLANLAGLFRQSREPGSLPVRQEVFYYLRPLVGALTALVVFFVVAAGVIAFSAGEASASWGRVPSRMTYVALSLLTGLGAYEILDRLQVVLRALFSR